MSTPITFVVPGYPVSMRTRGGGPGALSPLEDGTLKQSVTVATSREQGGEVDVTAVPGEDIVVLHLEGGLSLTLHPENAVSGLTDWRA